MSFSLLVLRGKWKSFCPYPEQKVRAHTACVRPRPACVRRMCMWPLFSFEGAQNVERNTLRDEDYVNTCSITREPTHINVRAVTRDSLKNIPYKVI